MGETETMVPAPAGPSRAGLKWAAAAVVLCVAGVTLAVYYGWSSVSGWTKHQVVNTAMQQGVVLELSDVEVSLNNIHLREARASLEGVEGLTAYLQSVDIDMSWFKPTRMQIEGVVLQLEGPPLGLAVALRSWQSRYPATASLSVPPIPEFENIKITWQPTANTAAFVELDKVTFEPITQPYAPIGQDIAVMAERAQVGTVSIAPLAAAVHSQADSVEVGLGSTKWEDVTARGGWKNQASADELNLSFGPIYLGPLLAKTGLSVADKKLEKAPIWGGASVLVPKDERKAYQGHWALEVSGWTPPHPPELQGFPFGKSTRVESSFEIDRTLTSANFMNTQLASGEFKLTGHAVASLRSLMSAHVQAELKGHIPCTALAGAVANSELGQAYGNWVAGHANQLVQGNVEVTVQLDADSSAPNQAKVRKLIGIGCGLKPMSVQDVLALGLPPPPDADLVEHLEKNLPTWGAQLVPMPSVKLPDLHLFDFAHKGN